MAKNPKGSSGQIILGNDPERLFVAAVAFERAADLLIEAASAGLSPDPKLPNVESKYGSLLDATKANLMTPAVVNSAFSIEVYFKCLHVLAGGVFPGGHDLRSLFNALPVPAQARIRVLNRRRLEAKGLSPAAGGHEADFFDLDKLLAEQRASFASFRYAFETRGVEHVYSLARLPVSVRAYILELKPEWSRHAAPYS